MIKIEDLNKLSVLNTNEAIELFKSIERTHGIYQRKLNDNRVFVQITKTEYGLDSDNKPYQGEPELISCFFVEGNFEHNLIPL
jgi:hypothetical protein